MKSSNSKFILLVLLMVALGSCAKPVVNRCTLTKLYQNGPLSLQFFILNEKIDRIEQYDANGNVDYYYVITRDELGRLDHLDAFYGDGSLYYRRHVTYNVDGNIGKIYIYNDLNGDLFPENFLGLREAVYNSNKEIIELKQYNSSFAYVSSDYYLWSAGNVTRGDQGVGTSYQTNAYDDKPSMYATISQDLFSTFLIPTYLSANNVSLITYYDNLGNQTGTYGYAYSYNADGYPESESLHGYTYEYHCVQE